MKKNTLLRVCDLCLLLLVLIMLSSSLQLELTHSGSRVWIWLHMFAGTLFFAGIIWHICLHFKKASWIKRFRTQKSLTKWLAVLGLLTMLSAVSAMIHRLSTAVHSPIGGIHGKLGLAFLLLAIIHTARRANFFGFGR